MKTNKELVVESKDPKYLTINIDVSTLPLECGYTRFREDGKQVSGYISIRKEIE
jgi:hypothetical protein